jgi:alkylated DNA repair dioxygenase AlkB
VSRATDSTYNSVLANYYRSGRDAVAWHSDDEEELGPAPTIASVSFGATRRFLIRERGCADHDTRHLRTWKLDLEHGDLLVMRNHAQTDYLHALPRTTAVKGPRLNLTFRWIHV